jgi:ferrous iron transport protein B
MNPKQIVVALAGNPNSGKTTLFNNLTGARQHVGNWPGVTVEKKEGNRSYSGYDIKVVDLPGVYSLTAFSPDEIVARDFIIEEKPDVVVDIVDAANLERNLYLAVQIMEMEALLVLALNMMDQAESKRFRIDIKTIAKEMGVPVVPMVASRNQGTEELLKEIVKVAEKKAKAGGVKIEYGRELEKQIYNLQGAISTSPLAQKYSPRWLALKLIEGDAEIMRRFKEAESV